MSSAGTINNGRTVRIDAGDGEVPGGLVERGGATQVAFFGELRRLRAAEWIAIDGAPWRVLAVTPSEHVKRMVVMTVAREGSEA